MTLPNTGRARRWLDEVYQRGIEFSYDLHGTENLRTIFDLRVVAVSIWQSSGGKPRFDKLDVAHCDALARTLPEHQNDDAAETFLVSVRAFYCFLNKYRLIPNADAVRVDDALVPLVERQFARFGLPVRPGAASTVWLN
jgi:hypothetical protein